MKETDDTFRSPDLTGILWHVCESWASCSSNSPTSARAEATCDRSHWRSSPSCWKNNKKTLENYSQHPQGITEGWFVWFSGPNLTLNCFSSVWTNASFPANKDKILCYLNINMFPLTLVAPRLPWWTCEDKSRRELSFQLWKIKPLQSCLKPAFFLMTSRGRLLWYDFVEGCEKMYFLLTWSLSWVTPSGEFMVSIASFKSYRMKHADAHFVNYGPI